MANRVLQMQLEELEENYKKAALFNPDTRENYLRRIRELEQIEELNKHYYKRTRLLG